ncbi:hypothetical protein HY032_00195 [Candidatus Gottesmanbacteria bacterium]|nr:hypothetical protein [Candidatus Gottesmanbacteria bacterium]
MKDIFKERDIENPDLGKLVATQVIKKDWRAFGRHPDYDALGDIANKTIQLVKQVFKNPLIQLLMQPKDNGGNV